MQRRQPVCYATEMTCAAGVRNRHALDEAPAISLALNSLQGACAGHATSVTSASASLLGYCLVGEARLLRRKASRRVSEGAEVVELGNMAPNPYSSMGARLLRRKASRRVSEGAEVVELGNMAPNPYSSMGRACCAGRPAGG